MSSFLHSVLVVDDRAARPGLTRSVESPASLGLDDPAEMIGQGYETWEDEDSLEEETRVEDQGLNEQALIDGFADEGVVCTVLRPAGPEESDQRRVLRLARTADALVLDWLLSEDRDMDAKEGPQGGPITSASLIEEIVREDMAGGSRLRFICVYTFTPGLTDIVEQIGQRLQPIFDEHPLLKPVEWSDLVITADGLRIEVVAKSGHSLPQSAPVLAESELPTFVANQFQQFAADGLLPNLALEAVSTIRNNAHRLLHRFHRDLDPAFISHRALTGVQASEEFAVGLVSDEFSALLQAATVESAVHEGAVNAVIDELLAVGPPKRHLMKAEIGTKSAPVSRAGAKYVLQWRRAASQEVKRLNLRLSSMTSLLMPDIDPEAAVISARSVDERFAILSALSRSVDSYGESLPPPVLRLGAIVSNGDRGYWLCLQPLCDSVRLRKTTQFPLVPLKVVDSVERRFDYMVTDGSRNIRLANSGVKFSDIAMVAFPPDRRRGTVAARWQAGGGWAFKASRKTRRFPTGEATWIGDLRDVKAVQAAVQMSTNLGRVGLDESEFLRVMAKRPS